MTIYSWLTFALWLALTVYWALSARALKSRTGSRWLWWREIAVRLGLFALVVLALQVVASPEVALYTLDKGMPLSLLGLTLGVSGIALAMLARARLDHTRLAAGLDGKTCELVTTGPYALVRHPLYGGLLLAMLGSAIAQSLLWLLPLVVYGPLFFLSARREEIVLLAQFSEGYAAYRRRTKMLLPFVL
jgi:protein-S-isoprenylcysteine O-methyltransferase Ste14